MHYDARLALLIIDDDHHRGLTEAPVNRDAPCHLRAILEVTDDVALDVKLLIDEPAWWLGLVHHHRLALIIREQVGGFKPRFAEVALVDV